jgi:hypothetical protein
MDRRKDTRCVVLFRTTFSSGTQESGEGSLLDVSFQGCKLATSVSFQSGKELILHLYPPGTILRIEARAIVRWTQDGQVGLEFVDIPSEDAKALHDLVDTIEKANMNTESVGWQTQCVQ